MWQSETHRATRKIWRSWSWVWLLNASLWLFTLLHSRAFSRLFFWVSLCLRSYSFLAFARVETDVHTAFCAVSFYAVRLFDCGLPCVSPVLSWALGRIACAVNSLHLYALRVYLIDSVSDVCSRKRLSHACIVHFFWNCERLIRADFTYSEILFG